ncbi:MAG TPA: hypothetical protein VJ875_13015 [Pyrinomonadaceae bacterium]|nr:hypothetical protein [Pyrinomonadaceae bacterium]
MTTEATIYITTQDQERITKLIEFTRERNNGSSRENVIEWEVPSGLRRLKVEEVLYQPESAGHYNL